MINEIRDKLMQIIHSVNRGKLTVALVVLAFLIINVIAGINLSLHNNIHRDTTLFIDYVLYMYLIFIPCWIYFVERMMPDTEVFSEIALKIAGEVLGFICIVLSYLNNFKIAVVEKTAELTASLISKYLSLLNTFFKSNKVRGWLIIALSILFTLYLLYIFFIKDMATTTGIVIKNIFLFIIYTFAFAGIVDNKEITSAIIFRSTVIFILLLIAVNLFIYMRKEAVEDSSLLDDIVPRVNISKSTYIGIQIALLVIAVCLYAYLFISHKIGNWSGIVSMTFEEAGSDIHEIVKNNDSYSAIMLFTSFFVAMLIPGIFICIEKATYNSILLKINNMLYTFAAQIFLVEYISNKLIDSYSKGMLDASPFTYILVRPVQVFLENLKETGKIGNIIFWIIIFAIIILAVVWYVCITLLSTYGITIFLSYILVNCFAYSIISAALPAFPTFSYMIMAYVVNIITSNITSRAIYDTVYVIKTEHF